MKKEKELISLKNYLLVNHPKITFANYTPLDIAKEITYYCTKKYLKIKNNNYENKLNLNNLFELLFIIRLCTLKTYKTSLVKCGFYYVKEGEFKPNDDELQKYFNKDYDFNKIDNSYDKAILDKRTKKIVHKMVKEFLLNTYALHPANILRMYKINIYDDYFLPWSDVNERYKFRDNKKLGIIPKDAVYERKEPLRRYEDFDKIINSEFSFVNDYKVRIKI